MSGSVGFVGSTHVSKPERQAIAELVALGLTTSNRAR